MLAGCESDDSANQAHTLPSETTEPLQDEVKKITTPSKDTEYQHIFDTFLRSDEPDAGDLDDEQFKKQFDELVRVSKQVDDYDSNTKKAFIDFLRTKLLDPSLRIQMEAAFHIAELQQIVGEGKKNAEFIPFYVELLQNDDSQIRWYALRKMYPVVVNSGLGEELRPLVKPLIDTLQHQKTLYFAMENLGHLGPMAREAIPHIRDAAERAESTTYDKLSRDVLQKIERIEHQQIPDDSGAASLR